MYNSTSIGVVGESAAIYNFTRRNIPILKPFSDNSRYDFVVDIFGKLLKIQCKTSQKIHEGAYIRFNICSTNGFTGEHYKYTEEDIDFYFLYCIENGYCGLIPINSVIGIADIRLRLSNPKNNNFNKVRFAKDYNFDLMVNRLFLQYGQFPFVTQYTQCNIV